MNPVFKIRNIVLLSALSCIPSLNAEPQFQERSEWQVPFVDAEWFNEAKFGMFIHWGLYSELGRGEWVMNRERIPIAEYKKLATEFNPVKFDADEWVAIAKAAGMKYMTITSKHHDGFALFDSEVSDWNIVDATPFKRDVIKELSEACAKEGIKFGVYYSQAQDWTHTGGSMSRSGYWDPAQVNDHKQFREYVDTISIPQMKEVIEIGNISHLWFDTPIKVNPEIARKMVEEIRAAKPDVLLNSRLLYHGHQIEELTPEQLDELAEIGVDFLSYHDRKIPAKTFAEWPWETCMTLNGAWGYRESDNRWKSPKDVVQMLAQCASKGGNFLLNFGPTAEGVIPEDGVEVVKQVGDWLRINGESIYGTQGSKLRETGATKVGPGVNLDGSMKKESAADKKAKNKNIEFDWLATSRPATDGQPAKVYLHIFTWPGESFEVKGITETVEKAYFLANTAKSPLKFSQKGDAFTLSLPSSAPDPIGTVVCLEF
ncbi:MULTISPECIES: alpha-L-fucosidase [unclassified Lentimonas]|uniref:alpha-L-fucosidase n=1 Tax=unclassified Lentimonas TaxID=2630993 RepID=UPI00132452EF|nr:MULTISPECIES: alpha-L-fucosidase [unclassified Lentimonas]CAA6690016.1 Alpha-L-fucosidase (EC [Lentimonas sp. CC10]CAA6691091.1 Alpha-L-fucosidase (EC [Lentimonas sp. CC19]CAA7069295.1 Alpha-L-fucosidase (EC [Lentimonas sp. CC11]